MSKDKTSITSATAGWSSGSIRDRVGPRRKREKEARLRREVERARGESRETRTETGADHWWTAAG